MLSISPDIARRPKWSHSVSLYTITCENSARENRNVCSAFVTTVLVIVRFVILVVYPSKFDLDSRNVWTTSLTGFDGGFDNLNTEVAALAEMRCRSNDGIVFWISLVLLNATFGASFCNWSAMTLEVASLYMWHHFCYAFFVFFMSVKKMSWKHLFVWILCLFDNKHKYPWYALNIYARINFMSP